MAKIAFVGLGVDHTTASAMLARELDALAGALGLAFLDAPVSGGQAGAQTGQLGIMVGATPGTFDGAKPVLDLYARGCALIGLARSGQLTEMVDQICVAGALQGLAGDSISDDMPGCTWKR
jgi:3-hydroxyisobutyrate dehydrogenase-like beta-hydroxyacid dehydrogenase